MRTETSVTSWWGGKSLNSMRMSGLLVPLSTTTRFWENVRSTTLIIVQTLYHVSDDFDGVRVEVILEQL